MQNQAQIDQVLRQKSDAREIPGVVATAADSKEVIYQGAHGKRDLSKDDAMTVDSVFWIASMSKAITAAAGMQLVEQGKLSLDAPIGKVLPDLAAPQVLEGYDAAGEPKLRPSKNPITLRHLMTHTAGFAYDMWNGDMVKYLEKTGTPGVTSCKNDALKTPLMTDPGTRWEYGTNIDFVGKAVEAASGKRLDAYLREVVLGDLRVLAGGYRIVEDVADDQLAAVLLAELPVEFPAQAVEVLAGLVRVVSGWGAVVLVTLLTCDVDVVVQRRGMSGQAVLNDVDDGLAIDTLAHRQPQPLVGHDGPLGAVEREVEPGRRGGAPDHDAGRALRGDHIVEGGDAGGIDCLVLQRRDDGSKSTQFL